jgi:hypothetical protein
VTPAITGGSGIEAWQQVPGGQRCGGKGAALQCAWFQVVPPGIFWYKKKFY